MRHNPYKSYKRAAMKGVIAQIGVDFLKLSAKAKRYQQSPPSMREAYQFRKEVVRLAGMLERFTSRRQGVGFHEVSREIDQIIQFRVTGALKTLNEMLQDMKKIESRYGGDPSVSRSLLGNYWRKIKNDLYDSGRKLRGLGSTGTLAAL